ncbi:MAG: hypothetical protein ACR2IS_16280 [Nitrososphaeraceae archaeon]
MAEPNISTSANYLTSIPNSSEAFELWNHNAVLSHPHSYAMLYNSLTKPCGELPKFGLLCNLKGTFYHFLQEVGDDKHAIFVEENVKA